MQSIRHSYAATDISGKVIENNILYGMATGYIYDKHNSCIVCDFIFAFVKQDERSAMINIVC